MFAKMKNADRQDWYIQIFIFIRSLLYIYYCTYQVEREVCQGVVFLGEVVTLDEAHADPVVSPYGIHHSFLKKKTDN